MSTVRYLTGGLAENRWLGGWRRTVLLVGLALVVRVAYWRFAIPHYGPNSDASQYSELAGNVAHGHGLAMHFPQLEVHPTAFRPPVYPLLLGVWWWTLGSTVGAGQILSLVTGLATVLLTELVARRLAGVVAGLVAAVAVAVYLPLVANDVVLLTESLSLVLLLASLLFLVDRRPALAGFASGLLILTRPSAQGLAVVIALWLWWVIGWRRTLWFVGLVAITISPWIIRNEVEFGSPLMYTSNGFNLAAMYSTQAQDTRGFVDPVMDPRFDDLRLTQFDEVIWDRTLRKRGLDGLKAHPFYVLRVMGGNSKAWFELAPSFGDSAERLDGRNITVRHWALPEFYVFTLGGIAGLVVSWKRRETVLLAGISLYFTLTSLVFLSPPRLRAPFDLISCIGLGLLAAWWTERRGFSPHRVAIDGTLTEVGPEQDTNP